LKNIFKVVLMRILVIDKVPKAKEIFNQMNYEVNYSPGMETEEVSKIIKDYDALIVRSSKIHDVEFNGNIKAVGRAGAGVNNIPVEKCAEKGIVVFNAPGANANAVKEIVVCSLILASRGIAEGIEWTRTLKEDIVKEVEKNKSRFKGSEIRKKKLAVIGLGAIGRLVANAASALRMDVSGYDPFITVENAWRLSRNVKKSDELKALVAEADYVTIHVPCNEKTERFFNKELFDIMKPGVKILNFARGELVDMGALKEAMNKGTVERYITDFPSEELVGNEKVTIVPHLGASTHEAEDNCAEMVSEQVNEFLKKGNVGNSVNYPNTSLEENGGKTRLGIFNKNVPGTVSKISEILGEAKLNIHGMINKSRGDYAYNIVDIDGSVADEIVDKIKGIEEVVRVRKIER